MTDIDFLINTRIIERRKMKSKTSMYILIAILTLNTNEKIDRKTQKKKFFFTLHIFWKNSYIDYTHHA